MMPDKVDRLFRKNQALGIRWRPPCRRDLLHRRGDELLPALQEARVRPVWKRRGGLGFSGLKAHQKTEKPAKLVGDLHELHCVHVAREHHEAPWAVSWKRGLQRRAEL